MMKLALLKLQRRLSAWEDSLTFNPDSSEDHRTPAKLKAQVLRKQQIFTENFKLSLSLAQKLVTTNKNRIGVQQSFFSEKFLTECTKILDSCDSALLKGIPITLLHWKIITELAQVIHDIMPDVKVQDIEHLNVLRFDTKIVENFEDFHKGLKQLLPVGYDELEVDDLKNSVKPIKIVGMLQNWSALHKWNFTYLEKIAGNRKTVIESGRKYTDSDWTQKIMTFSEFLKSTKTTLDSPSKFYLAQHDFIQQVPILEKDIEVPEICENFPRETIERSCWIGPSGTHSPRHNDPKMNIYCQVLGNKVFKFDETYCVLRAGEAVFIPRRHHHEVVGVSAGIGINFWFGEEENESKIDDSFSKLNEEMSTINQNKLFTELNKLPQVNEMDTN